MISIIKATAEFVPRIKELESLTNLSPWSIDDYFEEITRKKSLFWVAVQEQELLGFIIARPITNSFYSPASSSENNLQIQNIRDFVQDIEIYNIAVAPSFRRRKVGAQLLRKIFNTAGKMKAERILLEVRKSNNAALKFYEKHGFETIGERKNFYSNPTENALLMCRSGSFENFP